MRFEPTPLDGAYVVDIEPHVDERGFFARGWCQQEFAERGLEHRLVQCDISYNRRAGTLRGMHLQRAPHMQAKLVRCTRGAIFDAIVDVRTGSRTYGRHFSVELSAENHRMIYIPAGFAHGFQALMDDTEVFYQMSEFYAPAAATGFRWDDPAVGIRWPVREPIMNDRDRAYPSLLDLGLSVAPMPIIPRLTPASLAL